MQGVYYLYGLHVVSPHFSPSPSTPFSSTKQFEIPAPAGEVIPAVTFAPFSKYPPCFKDVSFWVPASGFHENQVHEVVLSTAGELIEDVDLIDEFVNPKTGRRSCCFRLTYRSLERTLVNAEIDALQEQVRADLEQKLDVELR